MAEAGAGAENRKDTILQLLTRMEALHRGMLTHQAGAEADLRGTAALGAELVEVQAELAEFWGQLAFGWLAYGAIPTRYQAMLTETMQNLGFAPGAAHEDQAKLTEAMRKLGLAPGLAPEDQRDWAGGLPAEVLAKIAGKVVAQTEAGLVAELERQGWTPGNIRERMEKREREGTTLCLFVFARVCKGWRKAQLMVGRRMRTEVRLEVILPGRVALVKWALAEGCPTAGTTRKPAGVFSHGASIAHYAAFFGYLELVKWLWAPQPLHQLTVWGERGFPMDEEMMNAAAQSGVNPSGNLKLVQWLRGEGCPWHRDTCFSSVMARNVEVLRWARANGCPWDSQTRDMAAERLAYTDDFSEWGF